MAAWVPRRPGERFSAAALWSGLLVGALLTLGCGDVQMAPEPTPAAATVSRCGGCHGSGASLAPAPDLLGSDDPLMRGVGAHAAHVLSPRLSAPVPCTTCHLVPPSMQEAEHLDGRWPAEVSFSGLALAGGTTPVLAVPEGSGRARDDRALKVSCGSVYCHGATLSGGQDTSPVWNQPDARWTRCEACHGAPPPAPHPQSTGCGQCHAGYSATSVDVTKHVNGVLDVGAQEQTCTTCHGDAQRAPTADNPQLAAAPPSGTRAETLPTQRAVGAHEAHLTGAALGRPVACTECHVLPTGLQHADGTADVAFGALARAGGAQPSWDGASCAAYCHGSTLSGGKATLPGWTQPGPTWTSCDACHGAPPPAPHTDRTDCGSCHPGYGPDTVDAARHLNGVVDVNGLTCTSCHGEAGRAAPPSHPELAAAPPRGTRGETSPTQKAVGAHQAHLEGGTYGLAVACTECHPVPTSTSHANQSVEVAFGERARTGGATPEWNGVTCGSSYCHGNFTNGNRTNAPSWTAAAPLACDSCHGLPPGGTHPAASECASCHPGYTASSVNLTSHINGQVDVGQLGCSSCHGDATRAASTRNPQRAAAPPKGTRGETLPTQKAVGAHLAHLTDGTYSHEMACTECHAVPASPSHANQLVEIAFGALARTGGAQPAWNGTSCANSYCHGNFTNGNRSNAPSWTAASPLACNSCHGLPPAGTHPTGGTCSSCHPGYTSTSVNRANHVNGRVDLDMTQLTCTSCHGDAARAATTRNPRRAAAPPLGTRGETLPSQRAVGAHQAHLKDGAYRRELACTECHTVPATMNHANQSVDITFGPLARTGGAAPTWDRTSATCGSSYCHGNFTNGNRTNAPSWTAGGGLACHSCHGLPPGGTHPTSTDCAACHTGYTATSVNLANHINGQVDVIAQSCTSCHGEAGRAATTTNPQRAAAPPRGTRGETLATQKAVGSHQAHLRDGTYRRELACTECHSVPTAMSHANQVVDIAFGLLARTGGATPAWNGTSCTNSYCHGNFTNGNRTNAPSWTAGVAIACNSCHGLPPGGTHPTGSTCSSCHPGYTASSVNLASHINGRVDLDLTQLTCTSCHGDSARAASTRNPQRAAAPPRGTRGETLSTQRAVGAHQAHLRDGTLSREIACTECHSVPTTMDHANQAVQVTFGTLARTAGATPAWSGATCTNSYCHGRFTGGNTTNAPSWTASGPVACNSCHALAPSSGDHSRHSSEATCGDCHGTGYSRTTVNTALHVNGVDNVGGTGTRINSWNASTRSCSPTCHGSETW